MLQWLEQWLCPHPRYQTVLRREGRRMFIRCSRCGYESPGIITGGSVLWGITYPEHKYSQETIDKLKSGVNNDKL